MKKTKLVAVLQMTRCSLGFTDFLVRVDVVGRLSSTSTLHRDYLEVVKLWTLVVR